MRSLRGDVTSAGFLVAYVAAMLVGRALPIDGETLSVVWPACGVAALWMLSLRHAFPVVDLGLLAAATFLVNHLTGVAPALSVSFTVVNVVQALLAVALLRRFCPDLWGCGGRGTVDTLRSLFVTVGAGTVSSGVAAGAAAVALSLTARTPDGVSTLLHWGRNTFGFILVVTTVHLLAHTLVSPQRRHALVAAARARRRELLALVVVSAAVYALVLGQRELPLAFVPLIVTLWAGLRFGSVVAALQGTAATVVVLAATFAGTGPMVDAPDDAVRGLLVQLLLTIVVVSGLSLAASRNEAELLQARTHEGQRVATEQAAVLTTVIESMRQGLVVLDGAGQVIQANDVARRIMAAPTFVLAGSEPFGESVTWDQVAEIIVCERTQCGFDLVLGDSGPRTVVHVRGTPLLRHESRDEATVVVLDDVTADRASRAELQTFAASIAHDLRTPLTSVKGWAARLQSLAEEGTLEPATVTGVLERVIDNADRMQGLIGDLLEHATTQGAELQTRLASVTRLAREVAESVGVGATTTVERTPLVVCDKALVSQLLTNLFQNAVKYVAPGVTPRVHLAAVSEGDEVRFTVTDNGTGIPVAERERVFDRFYRGSTPEPGTGLGLSICRTIVERHGGTIHVEAGPGGLGSAFVFTLPAAVASSAPAPRLSGVPA